MGLCHIQNIAVEYVKGVMAKGWSYWLSGTSVAMFRQSALVAFRDVGNSLLGEVRPIVAFTDEGGGTVGTRMAKAVVVCGE
jgi:hypothetical protein